MRIREHRGGLAESMATVVDIEPTMGSVVTEVGRKLGREVKVGEVRVEPIGHDPKTGWDTHMVQVEGWGVYGFTDGPVMGAG